jgi:hypothetical protein
MSPAQCRDRGSQELERPKDDIWPSWGPEEGPEGVTSPEVQEESSRWKDQHEPGGV